MIQPQPLSNIDFEDIKSALIFYLKNNTKFTDFDYAGSNISQLIDVLAYNTFINSYNLNFALTELSLDTSTLRDNTTSIAQKIGYVPKNYTSSFVIGEFRITGLTGADFCNIEAGAVLTSADTGIIYTFNTLSNVAAPVDSSGNCIISNVVLKEGILLNINYIVDATDVDQRFIIPNSNVDINYIKVQVNSDIYKSSSIINNNSGEYVFYTNYVQDGQIEILFGENVFGKHPSSGDVVSITYFANNGSTANNISKFTYVGNIKAYYANTTNGIPVNINNITYFTSTSAGGTDLESLASIKFFAPRMYAAQNRTVTGTDYEVAVKTIYPNVKKISAIGGEYLNPPQFGTVQLRVQTIDGTPTTSAIKKYIIDYIKKNNVLSVTPTIVDPEYTTLRITPYILYDLRKLPISIDALRNKINVLVNNFIKDEFDIGFYGNKLQSQIYNLDDSIISVKLRLVMITNVPLNNNTKKYSMGFGAGINSKNCNTAQLASGAFKIVNNDNFVRLISTGGTNNISLQQYNNTSTGTMWSNFVDSVGNVNTQTGTLEFVVPPINNNSIPVISIPPDIDIIPNSDIVLVPNIEPPRLFTNPLDPVYTSEQNILSEPELSIIPNSVLDSSGSSGISNITIENIISPAQTC
jgi:hypothetical protein